MAFRDWSEDDYQAFQEDAYASVYNEIYTVPYLTESEDVEARDLFFEGWLNFDATEAQREAAREEFYDYVNIDPDEFDWQEWRDAYESV
jgi:hypothetical protein